MTEEQLKNSIQTLDSVELPDYLFLWQEHHSPKELMEKDVVMDSLNPELLALEKYVCLSRNKYAQSLRTVNDITDLD